ncbi:MAG: hypothetical protein KBG47_09240 [Bacteroidia bacterium]|nr:hypothetical protein [Bacteroidia bacterium]
MHKEKNVLLICWDFPPNYGIGGRRWAKFAKCLLRDGYLIHVIKSETPKGNITSPWLKDVDHKNISINNIKPHWAAEWLHSYDSLFSFVKIRFAKYVLKLSYKGTIFDKAIGIQDKFNDLAIDLIKKNSIKNVIVTGAPFNLIYYTALLKKDLKHLNIIADYRDPWINSVNYGMQHLTKDQLKQEREKQSCVFNYVDVITAPNDFLIEQIKQTHVGKANVMPLFLKLQHFFDSDDVVLQRSATNKEHNKLKLVYAGALYSDTERYLSVLTNSILKFKGQFPDIKVEVDLYTKHKSVAVSLPELKENIRFLEPIGDKIFNVVRESDLFIILLSDHNKDFKTTKFYEFLPYKVPYLLVGPKGHVSESIEKEALGFLLTEEQDLSYIYKKLLTSKELKGFRDIDKYSLDNSTQVLNSILKN